VKLSAVRKTVPNSKGRTVRTDEQQCLSMKPVLTVGLTKITSEHAIYGESRQVRYEVVVTEDSDLVVNMQHTGNQWRSFRRSAE